jgi:hypothetical protein
VESCWVLGPEYLGVVAAAVPAAVVGDFVVGESWDWSTFSFVPMLRLFARAVEDIVEQGVLAVAVFGGLVAVKGSGLGRFCFVLMLCLFVWAAEDCVELDVSV